MHSIRRVATACAAASLLLLAGCELPKLPAGHSGAGEIAIIDLDAIAKALGRDVALRSRLEDVNAKLDTQLSDLIKGLRTRLEREKEKLGPDPTAAAQKAFQKLAAEAQLKVRKGQLQVRQRSQKAQLELVARFRAEVLPVAQKIALERGTRVIVLRSNVLWYDQRADITPSVVIAMQGLRAEPGKGKGDKASASAPRQGETSPSG